MHVLARVAGCGGLFGFGFGVRGFEGSGVLGFCGSRVLGLEALPLSHTAVHLP